MAKWTKEQEEYLLINYEYGKEEDLINNIGKNFKAISEYARKKGMKRNWKTEAYNWKENEIQYLKNNFVTESKENIETNLNRNWPAIQNKAIKLGLSRMELVYKWTEDRIFILKELYPRESEQYICEVLKTKWSSIQGQANKIGIKRNFKEDIQWTEEKKELLKSIYWNNSWKEIFEKMGTDSKASITSMAAKLKIERKRDWKKDEDSFLLENYGVLSLNEISESIERTIVSVLSRASKLGLRQLVNWNAIPDDDILKLLKERILEIERTPQWRELTELGLPSPQIYSKRFGSYQKALNLLGYSKGNAIYGVGGYSKDGYWCKSQSEIRISNFLFDNNISYLRERYYKEFFPEIVGRKSVDWYLNDYGVFVEYFGLPEKIEYKRKMESKIELSKKYNFVLISISPKDLKNDRIEEIFKPYM